MGVGDVGQEAESHEKMRAKQEPEKKSEPDTIQKPKHAALELCPAGMDLLPAVITASGQRFSAAFLSRSKLS
jgi:hypothetical protein